MRASGSNSRSSGGLRPCGVRRFPQGGGGGGGGLRARLLDDLLERGEGELDLLFGDVLTLLAEDLTAQPLELETRQLVGLAISVALSGEHTEDGAHLPLERRVERGQRAAIGSLSLDASSTRGRRGPPAQIHFQ